jgi:three-Cys-motif partner protein
MQNRFGGSWTETKIQILVKYTKAYLTIMNKYRFKLIYFDGFAGSGDIMIGNEDEFKIIKGAAKEIVSITDPISFDIYYFVELDKDKSYNLEYELQQIRENNVHVVNADCNKKLVDLAKYLRLHSNFRALVFLDPFGMNLDWNSVEVLKDLGVDIWLLSPTGLGAGRGLKRRIDGIPDSWWSKLETFFGVDRRVIQESFYEEVEETDLFGQRIYKRKISQSNNKLFELYKKRTLKIFKYVSDPYVIVNKNNSLMYHFFCASNNTAAIRIANGIVKQYSPIK